MFTLEAFSTMKCAVVIEKGPSSYGATVPDLPGCFAVAGSREEVERLIQEAIEEHVALLQAQGLSVPELSSSVAEIDVEVAKR